MRLLVRIIYLMEMKFYQYILCSYYKFLIGGGGGGLRVYGSINIKNPSGLYLGANCSLNDDVYINALGNVTVGDNVAFSAGAKIIATGLDVEALVAGKSVHISNGIKIGSNVQIGAGAIILDGLNIGSGVVIGAGAVVTRDVPDRVVVTGVPARIVKEINEPPVCR